MPMRKGMPMVATMRPDRCAPLFHLPFPISMMRAPMGDMSILPMTVVSLFVDRKPIVAMIEPALKLNNVLCRGVRAEPLLAIQKGAQIFFCGRRHRLRVRCAFFLLSWEKRMRTLWARHLFKYFDSPNINAAKTTISERPAVPAWARRDYMLRRNAAIKIQRWWERYCQWIVLH